jgi:hypothetical protein
MVIMKFKVLKYERFKAVISEFYDDFFSQDMNQVASKISGYRVDKKNKYAIVAYRIKNSNILKFNSGVKHLSHKHGYKYLRIALNE